MDIFVGNLLFEATGADVKKLFEGFGNVASVVIAMEKEKKAPKSRGFGFVQMPDEQQALAAIAALNGKEFMGRVLNVDPAHPKGQKAMVWPPIAKAKTEVQAVVELKEGDARPYGTPPYRNGGYAASCGDRRVRPSPSGQPGTYIGGRRTRSYMKRQVLAGVQEDIKPRRRSHDNPMRWRKRGDQPRPWQKNPDEHKPWKKAEGESKPWRKSEGGFKPWKKPEGESRPWKKPAGEAKPWSKSSGHPQESRLNPSASLGMVRGNGKRSRTKSRRKPGGYKR